MAGAELDDVAARAELEAAGPPRRTRLRLETAAAVRAHLVGLYAAVRDGRLSALEANRQARRLAAIADVNRDLGLGRRLRRLEAAADAKRSGR